MFDNTPTVYVRAWWRPARSIEVAAFRFRTPPTDDDLGLMNEFVDVCVAEQAVATAVRKRLADHPDLDRKVRLHTSWVGPDRATAPTPAELESAALEYQTKVIEEESWKTGV